MPSSEVMHKFKHGKLHSGSSKGPIVKDPQQAKAILMSEKRTEAEHGGKYPEKKGYNKGGGVDKSSAREVHKQNTAETMFNPTGRAALKKGGAVGRRPGMSGRKS